jgi:type II secretory pathway pseudopilin PulG
MFLRRSPQKAQTGDTIVEVLIAVAVISMILVAAYAITNHNTLAVEDTQEHSQALQLAQEQIEFLRTNGAPTGSNTCFSSSGASASGAACVVGSDGTPTTGQPAYNLSVTAPGGTPPSNCQAGSPTAYTICAYWDSLLRGQKNNIALYYRPQQ